MSVRVNLLPSEVKERGRANRSRLAAAAIAALLVVLLGVLTVMQRAQIGDAEDRLAQVEGENQALEADIAALQPFADLESRASTSAELISQALAEEKSLAGILQDISTVLPPDAEVDTLAVTFFDEPGEPSAGGDRLIVGALRATGRVLSGLAPGVERLAIDLERVAAFENVFVTTTTTDDEGVTSFEIEAELGPEVLTGRYDVLDTEESE